VTRDSGGVQDLAGMTELVLGPLRDPDARALLASRCPAGYEATRDRIIAEFRGNPLAVL
jgi:hypothetical protein